METPMRRAVRRAGWTLVMAGIFASGIPAEAQTGYLPPGNGPVAEESAPAEPAEAPDHAARVAEIKVQLAWLGDPLTCPYHLGARVVKGKMVVQGYVPNTAVKRRILKLAGEHGWPVSDALKIYPRLAICPVGGSPREVRAAALVELKKAFPRYAAHITVECRPHGQLTVSGFIPSYEEKLAVSQKLRRLNGCLCVVNELIIPEVVYQGKSYTQMTADGQRLVPIKAGAQGTGEVVPQPQMAGTVPAPAHPSSNALPPSPSSAFQDRSEPATAHSLHTGPTLPTWLQTAPRAVPTTTVMNPPVKAPAALTGPDLGTPSQVTRASFQEPKSVSVHQPEPLALPSSPVPVASASPRPTAAPLPATGPSLVVQASFQEPNQPTVNKGDSSPLPSSPVPAASSASTATGPSLVVQTPIQTTNQTGGSKPAPAVLPSSPVPAPRSPSMAAVPTSPKVLTFDVPTEPRKSGSTAPNAEPSHRDVQPSTLVIPPPCESKKTAVASVPAAEAGKPTADTVGEPYVALGTATFVDDEPAPTQSPSGSEAAPAPKPAPSGPGRTGALPAASLTPARLPEVAGPKPAPPCTEGAPRSVPCTTSVAKTESAGMARKPELPPLPPLPQASPSGTGFVPRAACDIPAPASSASPAAKVPTAEKKSEPVPGPVTWNADPPRSTSTAMKTPVQSARATATGPTQRAPASGSIAAPKSVPAAPATVRPQEPPLRIDSEPWFTVALRPCTVDVPARAPAREWGTSVASTSGPASARALQVVNTHSPRPTNISQGGNQPQPRSPVAPASYASSDPGAGRLPGWKATPEDATNTGRVMATASGSPYASRGEQVSCRPTMLPPIGSTTAGRYNAGAVPAADWKTPYMTRSQGPVQLVRADPPTSSLDVKARLNNAITMACGNAIKDVEVVFQSSQSLRVRIKGRKTADGDRLAQTIFKLPELKPYEVDLDITVDP
jgi:hypothetical protein